MQISADAIISDPVIGNWVPTGKKWFIPNQISNTANVCNVLIGMELIL